jgi:hypothetical protein
MGLLIGLLKLYIPPGLTLKILRGVHVAFVFCMDLRTNSNFYLIKH